LQPNGRACRGLFIIWLPLFRFVIPKWLDRGRHRPRAMLRQRFSRQDNIVLAAFDRSARPAIIRRPPVIKTAAVVAVTLRGSIF